MKSFALLMISMILLFLCAALGTGIQDIASISHLRTEWIVAEAVSGDGAVLHLDVSRTQSVEQIPFAISYEVEAPEGGEFTWQCVQTGELVVGEIASFVLDSNALAYDFHLVATASDGTTYNWTDSEIWFFLHNQTEISLDAIPYGAQGKFDGWTASNVDPADIVTFPIAVSSDPQTIMVSEWPNVIDVIARFSVNNAIVERSCHALIYCRDGSPFELRGFPASLLDQLFDAELASLLPDLHAIIDYTGANAVTTALTWYYGPPVNSVFEIHPIEQPAASRSYASDPRGFTPYTRQFTLLAESLVQQGIDVHVQLLVGPYQDDPAGQTWGSGWGEVPWVRSSDGFLYSEYGMREFFLHYLPVIIETSCDLVYFGAEEGDWIVGGGEEQRRFHSGIIEEYRTAGYSGALSHASPSMWGNWSGEKREALLDPHTCGIPYSELDAVAVTVYIPLAEEDGESIENMRKAAAIEIDRLFKSFSEAYGKPLIIADLKANGIDGCSTQHFADHSNPYDPDEQIAWYMGWLRALADANWSSSTPWIQGVMAFEYRLILDKWLRNGPIEWREKQSYLNSANQRPDLRELARVFFFDAPLATQL